jgi:hypothetical protein
MKRKFLFPVVIALVAVQALSQDGEEPKDPAPHLKTLIDQLGSPEFESRKAAEEALLELGEDARDALAEAKESHPDTHVRFEAERLLGLIEARAAKKEQPLRERDPRLPLGGRDEDLNRLLRELEERGFLGPEDWEKFFKVRPGHPGLGGGASLHGSMDDGREKIEYEQGQDGKVTVRITGEDGETKSFEAESWEAFQEAHPEVFEKVRPMLGGIRIRIGEEDWPELPDLEGFGDVFKRFRELEERMRGFRPWTPEPAPRRAPGGFRLGIWVGGISPALRLHLGLRAGQGVLVEDVVPGSLAAELGIERYDVVLTVNGRPVADAEGIRAAVAATPEGESLTAEVIRRGEPLTLHR